MPATVAATDRRDPRLLSVLFWIGVALAPVAALILLVADGNGPLRFAAVLAILAVVLIGLSIALRADGDGGHGEAAEELRDEIDQLRRELRGEIVAAAQRGNQALDVSQRAQEQVGALRRRLDAAAAGIAADPDPPAAQPAGAGRARVASAETYADAGPPGDAEEAPAAGLRAPARPDDASPGHRLQPAPRHGADGPPRPGVYGGDRPAEPGVSGGDHPARPGVYGAPPRPAEPGPRAPQPAAPEPAPAPRPVGVVRRTETVHVTTRHTVVDGPDPAAGGYGGHGGERWSPAPGGDDDRWSPAPQERPWSGGRLPAAGEPEGPPWSGGRRPAAGEPDGPPWTGGRRPVTGEPDGPPWTGHADPVARVRGADAHRFPEPAAAEPFDDRAWARQPSIRDEPAHAARGEARGAAVQPQARGGYRGPRAGGGDGQAGRHEADRVPAYPPAPAASGQWSEAEAGDRWAEVRDDDRGREVRVGERRATAHADATSSGYRVEDRWAAVRQGDPYPQGSPGDRWWDGAAAGAGAAGPGGWPDVDGSGADRSGRPGHAGPGGGTDWEHGTWSEPASPALPAGGVPVPTQWRSPARREAPSAERWAAAEPEPARPSRHQRADGQRYGYPPPDETPRAGAARPADHWR
ncbi:hypothetical protein [Micromonospora carbonacea]|uniref:Uncharacterized protein n=1 Tax=Micromonospora carbonacea TaxID=47853 RepID=A0A1C4TZG8_9ACTN|nr:hypothetical protein [Micromonospora carbonacea]SCE64852.1 hypothetical protein GA0070563_101135 [Micromonospora carbonacea]